MSNLNWKHFKRVIRVREAMALAVRFGQVAAAPIVSSLITIMLSTSLWQEPSS